jgi:hypothetical protein
MTSSNKDHLENVDFNCNWQFCSRSINDNVEDNNQWLLVRLPHNDNNLNDSLNYWYKKEFYWFLSNQRLEEKIFLHFQRVDHQHRSNLNINIWINGEQICSKAFLSEENQFELTEYLLKCNKKEVINKESNRIVICSNKSLCFNARLIIHGNIKYRSGEIIIQDKIISNDNENNILNYTIKVNDDDGQIGVVIKDSPSIPSKHLIESISNTQENPENNEDIPVPHLAIVILIVGTRGDVQPFIA